MNIGIIGHLKYAICEPFAGGLEMHTHLLATSLEARGHRVTLFAARGSDCAAKLIALCAPTGSNPLSSSDNEQIAYSYLMNHLISSDFDVIHNNSLHPCPLERCGDLPMPMVTTLHTPPFAPLDCAAASLMAPSHQFVVVSKTLATKWEPLVKIDAVIANGVDLAQFRPRTSRADQQYADQQYWVWHGRIVPEKGLEIAIQAARVAKMALRFAGPLADTAYFIEQILPLMDDRISYEGHLTHAALTTLVGGASVCLCTPRWDEPFGLVIAEALACGTPVAGFRRGALPELLDPSCGVLIEGENPVHLAAAARAASHLDRAACHTRARRCWDADRMITEYETLYTALAATQRVRCAA